VNSQIKPSIDSANANELEYINCYFCDSNSFTPFLTAQEDLTGKPGYFQFVQCDHCGLHYQNPRLSLKQIQYYYDDEYIAHRKKTNWGILTNYYNYLMDGHDRRKCNLVKKYVKLNQSSNVLDVGCGAGTFLYKLKQQYRINATGVDFKDLSSRSEFSDMEFLHGVLTSHYIKRNSIDLITMWHFLEHDYDPINTLRFSSECLKEDGRLIIEVPRLDSLSFKIYQERWPGLQAPQHTVLYTKKDLLHIVECAGLDVVEYLPYGAFPPYFYLFAGAAFKILKGKGLNLSKAIYPYFAGQIILSPIMLFQKHLNLAMQTIICRRK